MPRCLNLALAGALACFVVGCATQSKPTLTSGQRIPRVRTTAYTHHEGGSGAHNAVGTYLSGRHVLSAASDWSRYPLGTRFRLADASEEYVIDDYGNALVGTDTIDLYKATGSDVKNWGVRYVDIDILQWGLALREWVPALPSHILLYVDTDNWRVKSQVLRTDKIISMN